MKDKEKLRNRNRIKRLRRNNNHMQYDIQKFGTERGHE